MKSAISTALNEVDVWGGTGAVPSAELTVPCVVDRYVPQIKLGWCTRLLSLW